jgi:hypothetical protein
MAQPKSGKLETQKTCRAKDRQAAQAENKGWSYRRQDKEFMLLCATNVKYRRNAMPESYLVDTVTRKFNASLLRNFAENVNLYIINILRES